MVSSDVGKEGGGPWSSAGCGGGGGCGGSSSGLCTFKQSSHNVHCNRYISLIPSPPPINIPGLGVRLAVTTVANILHVRNNFNHVADSGLR